LKPPKLEITATMILSAAAGLTCAAAWLVSDVLLLGNQADPSACPALAESAFVRDKELAAAVAAGLAGRQVAGAALAVFAGPLMILAAPYQLALLKPAGRLWSSAAVGLLFVGFCWSPQALATYLHLGQTVRMAMTVESSSAESVLVLAGAVEGFLLTLWAPAMAATVLGWLLASAAMLAGRSGLPRLFGLVTPLPMGALSFAVIHALPPALSVPLSAAGISLGALIFHSAALVWLVRRRLSAA
jgi:hypothetical protein